MVDDLYCNSNYIILCYSHMVDDLYCNSNYIILCYSHMVDDLYCNSNYIILCYSHMVDDLYCNSNYIILCYSHMVDDLKSRTVSISAETIKNLDVTTHYSDQIAAATSSTDVTNSNTNTSNTGPIKSLSTMQLQSHFQILDLEHNILQAKGLRTALCSRIVHTKIMDDTVIYVLRVEDVETGLQWVVHRRYRDFAALNDELSDMSHFTKVCIGYMRCVLSCVFHINGVDI